MPGRIVPLVTNQIYHVINRGIANQPIFKTKWDYKRFIETLLYYQNMNVPVRFSKFITLNLQQRSELIDGFNKQKKFIIEFICYCLMPNHFHFLIKQTEDNGIIKFMANISNSYTKYFNVKNKRNGPIFQGNYKAVRIIDDNQLLHVSRYIHLNPYSAYVVKDLEKLNDYEYSSLPEYLKLASTHILNKELILSQFKSYKSFLRFLYDQADYQRQLQNVKHLTLEN